MEQKGTGKALGDLAEALRELPREDKTTDVCEILLASSFVNVVHEHLFINIVLLLLFVSGAAAAAAAAANRRQERGPPRPHPCSNM